MLLEATITVAAMSAAAKKSLAEARSVEVRFGGWYDGDNHKPGRGFYYLCACGKVGLGQLLPQSAMREWKKHSRLCKQVSA